MDTKIISRRTSIFLGGRYTSLFNRCVAKAIDLLIVAAIYFLGAALWTPLGTIAGCLFCSVQDCFGIGQSIGKRIIGLRVIDDHNGLSCSLRNSILRNVPFLLATLFATQPILWILFIVISVPLVILEVYLLVTVDTGVRLGDVLGNTLVLEYVDESLESIS